MIPLHRIAERVLGRPLLLHPMKAELILSILGERIGVAPFLDLAEIPDEFKALRVDKPAANRLIGEPTGPVDSRGRLTANYYNRVDGVAVVPVIGTLINRGAFVGEDGSGFTSYESLMAQLAMAVEDTRIGHILLDIDSPGGEAGGMFALAQAIRTAGMRKPITALVNDMAASGAYGLAASASEIVASPTSAVGSIGVVLLHVDQSEEMKMKGRKPTLIYAGAHKVDGHSFGPLSAEVTADLQKLVDTYYAQFVETVAAGRSKTLTVDAARATEARIFIGAEGEAAGLIDRIDTFTNTIARLSASMRARSHHIGAIAMENLQPVSRAEHDAALTTARAEGRAEGNTAGIKEGEAKGAADALARVRAILALPEAKDRHAQALTLALDTEMTAEQATKLLATFPATVAADPGKTTPSLAERGQPPVPGNAPTGPAATIASIWDEAVAAVNKTVRQGAAAASR